MSLVGREIIGLNQHFGPYVCRTTISDELHDILLKVGNKIRKNKTLKKQNDYRKRLAGNLKEEYSYANAFTEKQNQIVNEELLWLASHYTKLAARYFTHKGMALEPHDILIQQPLWINYMKSGEWNPSHSHSGDISCVMYLKVPPEIEQENETSEISGKSNTPTAGRIELSYGDNIGYTSNGFMFTPKEKDILIFPARLRHMVYPFTSKTERISVSINFSDMKNAKRNLGMKI